VQEDGMNAAMQDLFPQSEG